MVGAAALQGPATGDLEILAVLPGGGVGRRKGGCKAWGYNDLQSFCLLYSALGDFAVLQSFPLH